MGLKDYFMVYKKQIHPYPVLLVAAAYEAFQDKYIHVPFNKLIVFIDNGMWQAYVNVGTWDKAEQKMFELYEEDPEIIDRFISEFKQDSKDFLKFTGSLVSMDCSKKSDEELLELYKKFNKRYVQNFMLGECPAELLKEALEKRLKERLLRIVKNKEKVNGIFSLLILPSEESFTTREEKALLRIAVKEDDSSLKHLEKHALDYNWVPVDYNGEPWSVNDFQERLEDMKAPEKMIDAMEKKAKALQEEQEALNKNLNLDKKTLDFCAAARKCMTLMDMKKEVCSKAHYHAQFLMKEIGHRLGLSLMQANYLMPGEMESAFKDGADRKILNKRYRKSAYVSDKADSWYLDEAEEEKLRTALEEKPKDAAQLEGTCGNPGKVTAKARVILKNEDFPKMKEGEILVTAYTTPDFVIIMKKASGIVTDIGGVTSHSSIVSRELDIPCVVGTQHATTLIKTGDTIELDAAEGKVKIIKKQA